MNTILISASGDDFEVGRTIDSGFPVDRTISKAWLTIKRGLADLDAAAVVQKEITTTVAADGEIAEDGTAGAPELLFWLGPLDTEAIRAAIAAEPDRDTLFYDIQVIDSESKITTLETGRISAGRQVTFDTA